MTIELTPPLKTMPDANQESKTGHFSREANQPILSVKRKLWRKDDDHAALADAAFVKTREDILRRDNHTCKHCAFKASKYQEIHHLDDNHQNNNTANLVTVCTLCHQVYHVGMCAMRNGGFIAVLPELTQTEINNIARALFVSELIANDDIKDRLKSLYAIFQFRGTDTLKTLFGIDISSPFTFAEVLSNCPDEMYARRQDLFGSLRLVPTKEAFHPGQLEYYATNNRPLFLPDDWSAKTRQLLM